MSSQLHNFALVPHATAMEHRWRRWSSLTCLMRLLAVSLMYVSFNSMARAQLSEEPIFSESDLEFFEKQVRPLLVTHCYECHGPGEVEGGLRLTSRVSILAGGDTAPAIVAGDPENSLLVDAIRYGDLYQMPPKSKLPDDDIETLIQWVRLGAPWPATDTSGEIHAADAEFDLDARKAAHWAWQPIRDPAPPAVNDTGWPADPLDQFILARLEAKDLQPAPDADPSALVRRAYFALTGLPPPSDKVAVFAANPTPEAWSQLIDELLASPRFGERWARHWLDLMRYAETRGHEYDFIVPNAWQYRDYVIRALNADVPYNQFVTEHVAGDLLDQPRRHPSNGFNESVLATGFWYLGEWVHSPVDIRQDETDRFDNAIDVYSKTFLGLTVACARCHDHKFDAISQADYYALTGFLQSSCYTQARFETMDQNREIARQLYALRDQMGRELARQVEQQTKSVRHQLPAMLAAAAEVVTLKQVSPERSELAAIAVRHGVSADRLVVWVEEVEMAGCDDGHPLHALAISLSNGCAAARQCLLANHCASRPQLGDAYQVVIDFDSPAPIWLTDGPAFGGGPLTPGTILPGLSQDRPIAEVVAIGRAELDPAMSDLKLKEGTEQNAEKLSNRTLRSGKVLRTPTVHLNGGKLYYLMRGGAQIHAVVDSHRTIAGPLHGSTLKDVERKDRLRWVEHDLSRYRGHGVHVEFAPKENDPLQLLMVVEGSTPPPEPQARINAPAWLATANSQDELIVRLAAQIEESLECLADDRRAEDRQAYAIAEWAANRPQLWTQQPDRRITALCSKYHDRRANLIRQLRKTSATAPAIWDGTAEDERLLIRGNPATPGEPVPRRMLAAIAGHEQPPLRSGSGRLELAKRTLAPSNPFPARVMVNRVWHHLMGRGIVPSVDNFGVLGQPPTHPELLDHLANRFMESGWSIKQLIRTVMLSRTYQMASILQSDAAEADPQNALYHRMPSKRLEAEAIRDAMLALSGRLDPTPFGPSVPVHLTEFMEGRGRPAESGPVDGGRRRSIYQAVRRNFLSPMMTAFDAPQPASPRGRRTVSNVPAQALMLLNNPFVRQQAEQFAERLEALEPDPVKRIDLLYLEALARPPMSSEATAAQIFLRRQASQWTGHDQGSSAEQAAWSDLCHVIFNTKEFIFLR